MSRLAGIPFLLVSLHIASPSWQWASLAVFLVAAGTDWLDGYLARRLDQVTDLGKFLDPLVDKLLVLAPLMVFVEQQIIPAWGVFLILARELAIAGWRVNPNLQGQTAISGANIWGKLKTVSQITAIAVMMIPLPQLDPVIGVALFWLSVALTLISGMIYLWPAAIAKSAPAAESAPQTE